MAIIIDTKTNAKVEIELNNAYYYLSELIQKSRSSAVNIDTEENVTYVTYYGHIHTVKGLEMFNLRNCVE